MHMRLPNASEMHLSTWGHHKRPVATATAAAPPGLAWLQERWLDFVQKEVADWQQSLRFETKKDQQQH